MRAMVPTSLRLPGLQPAPGVDDEPLEWLLQQVRSPELIPQGSWSPEPVRRAAQRLQILKPAPFVFTVAGTNGKGSTCKFLESILLAAGYRVGSFFSPHLLRYRERICIQGQPLEDSAVLSALKATVLERPEPRLSFFEHTTLAALWAFHAARLDVVILEVGLGGRLDATNAVPNDVAIVTSIALDHTHRLGSTRAQIAREKAGIFRPNRPAILADPDLDLPLLEEARRCGAHPQALGLQWSYIRDGDDTWSWQGMGRRRTGLPVPRLPLESAATALAALEASPFFLPENAVFEGVQRADLAGRFQILCRQPTCLLDVAHNPEALDHLVKHVRALRDKLGFEQIHLLVGMLKDKDTEQSAQVLEGLGAKVYCVPTEGPRGGGADRLAAGFKQAKCFESVEAGWDQATHSLEPQDVLLVTGSFRVVSEILGRWPENSAFSR